MPRFHWISRVPVADARDRLTAAVGQWKTTADAADLYVLASAGDVYARESATASLTVRPADLERVLFELARIDEVLVEAGIEYPLGALGVRDLAAFAEEREEPR